MTGLSTLALHATARVVHAAPPSGEGRRIGAAAEAGGRGRGERLSLSSPDGHAIPCTYWPSGVGGGCTVVCLHAFGDHREAFAEHARRLGEHGHLLVAFDQRGFGETPDRGVFAGAAAYVGDLAAVVANARHLAPNRPVVLLGESFGGSVALHALAAGPPRLGRIDGLILSGPGVREDLPAKSAWDMLIDGAAAVFGPSTVRIDQDDPRLTPAARKRFASDPLILKDVRADTYERIVALADAASADASRVRCPTLVLYGADDALIARASIDALMRRLGPTGLLKIYEGRPHLVLHSRDRRALDRDILHFLSTLA